MNANFEDLLKISTSNDKVSGVYKATVTTDVCHSNNSKSYVLVDIAGMKKQYMLYVHEFESIPAIGNQIEVVIIDNNCLPYGKVSHSQAIIKNKTSVYKEHITNKTIFEGIVQSKNQNKYDLKIENFNLKAILVTSKELKVGESVQVFIKNISNNIAYMNIKFNNSNNNFISYTNQFSVLQIVKCKIVGVGSLMFYVDIIDENEKVLLANGEANVVNCVVPFSDLGNKNQSSFELKSLYKIGDIFDAQIVLKSGVKLVLSKSSIHNQELSNIVKNVQKGQITNGKILSINENFISVEIKVNNVNIVSEMLINELAWSVAQREEVKNSVLIVGKEIKVQITGVDMRSGKIQVSYKNINLTNPVSAFKQEINPETKELWKVGDIITVVPTFDMKNENKRFFCYLNYKYVDIILYSWQEDAAGAKDILNKKPISVIISDISEEINGHLKIVVSYINSIREVFNKLVDKFVNKGDYRCVVVRSGKYENIVNPIAYINDGIETPLNIDNSDIDGKPCFILKSNDIPTNMRMSEGQQHTCKLVFIDRNKYQFLFSINAYNSSKDQKIIRDNQIKGTFNISL